MHRKCWAVYKSGFGYFSDLQTERSNKMKARHHVKYVLGELIIDITIWEERGRKTVKFWILDELNWMVNLNRNLDYGN